MLKKLFYVDYIFNLLIFKVNSVHLHNFIMRRLMIIYAKHFRYIFEKIYLQRGKQKNKFPLKSMRIWAYIEGEFFSYTSSSTFFRQQIMRMGNILQLVVLHRQTWKRITRNWQIVKNMFWFCYLWGKIVRIYMLICLSSDLCTGFTNISSYSS